GPSVGSRVSTTLRPCARSAAASRASWVDLPAPSMPSKATRRPSFTGASWRESHEPVARSPQHAPRGRHARCSHTSRRRKAPLVRVPPTGPGVRARGEAPGASWWCEAGRTNGVRPASSRASGVSPFPCGARRAPAGGPVRAAASSARRRLDLADQEERGHEADQGDRLDEPHAEDEGRVHRARGARVAGDAGGRVARREALAETAAERGEAERETGAQRRAPAGALLDHDLLRERDVGGEQRDEGEDQQLREPDHGSLLAWPSRAVFGAELR